LGEAGAQLHRKDYGANLMLPDPDGKHVWAGQMGAFTFDFTAPPWASSFSAIRGRANYVHLPAAHGEYHFKAGPHSQDTSRAVVSKRGGKGALAMIDALPVGLDRFKYPRDRAGRHLADLFHLVPKAGVLAVLSNDHRTLRLCPVPGLPGGAELAPVKPPVPL